MAIYGLVGVPGSGKTFFMVYWLAKNFCVQLKSGGYVLDPAKRVRVVTNIAGLQIPHDDFQTCLDAAGGFELFFTKEYQDDFSERYDHVIYIMDECHEWFHPRYCKLQHENVLYFTWARHHGHDLWFVTQDTRLLMPDISCIAENIVEAQPRSNQVWNEFTYIYSTSVGTELRTDRILFDKNIASLYKSQEKNEAVKIKNHRFRKYMLALAVSVLLFLLGLRSIINQWGHYFGESEIANSSAASPLVAKSSQKTAASHGSGSSTTLSGAVSSVVSPASQVEYYMYRLDYLISGGVLYLRLGISWIPYNKQFPYLVVLKGKNYFAVIPSILVNSLDDGSRALPIRIKPKTEG